MKTFFKRFCNRFSVGNGNMISICLCIFLNLLLFSGNLYSSDLFNSWGISSENVLKENVPSNISHTEFTPLEKPDYENKIMNMVNLILKNVDENVFKNIKIIRTGVNPRKDFLLYNNKLF
jgi:hypothetical protein